MIKIQKSVLSSACFLALAGVNSLYGNTPKKTESRPNVIFILTDDQGSVDVNCYGAKDLYTPNMDQLATTGIRFTQFYVAAPVCSPSRASLLTGKDPWGAGLPGNASSQRGHRGMPGEKLTIAEVMKKGGYITGHVGKWHLGYSDDTRPMAQGFDYTFGHMGGCIDNYSHYFYWSGPNQHDLWENGKEIYQDGHYFPDLMTEKVDGFIKEHRKDPFFLYYAINMPHYPLQPTQKWRDHYKDLPMPRRDYAAFVSTIDERIGRLLKTLDKYKLRENTIIIYQSDHGHSHEERTFGGGGDAGPFRGGKFSLFEGGIRIPAIISWKGHLAENQVRPQMAFNVDWFPTIAELCGVSYPKEAIDGRSLVPLLKGETKSSPHNRFWWKNGVQIAVREGDWKLIGNPSDPGHKAPLDPMKDSYFLVNLKEDSTEMVNLAERYPEKVEHLKQLYLEWEFGTEDDFPMERQQEKHKGFGKKVTLLTTPHPKYKSSGGKALTNGFGGSRSFSDGFWVGYEKKDMETIVDMGEEMPIQKVSVGFLQDSENWIFFPEKVEVSLSLDGGEYSESFVLEGPFTKDNLRKQVKKLEISCSGKQARFVKVKAVNVKTCPEWHKAHGGNAFMFADEIYIY